MHYSGEMNDRPLTQESLESEYQPLDRQSMCTQCETHINLKSNGASSCAYVGLKLKSKKRLAELLRIESKSERILRILVVDDDPIICEVIKDVLEPGYKIDVALNGRDATKKIQDGPLDMVIMDYHLPGLDGKQLYEWIEANYPSLKNSILFSTGDLLDENIHRFIKRTGCPCLYKPFSNSNLRETVSEMLSA